MLGWQNKIAFRIDKGWSNKNISEQIKDGQASIEMALTKIKGD